VEKLTVLFDWNAGTEPVEFGKVRITDVPSIHNALNEGCHLFVKRDYQDKPRLLESYTGFVIEEHRDEVIVKFTFDNECF
jgi:hypothetical protein